MKQEYQIIIDLVKSAITGEKVTLPENIDWSRIFKISRAHQIVPLIFYGAEICGLEFELKEKFFNSTMQVIAQEQNQLSAFEKISEIFDKNGIDYLPLKGIVLKELYPKSEMRSMSDIDILIRTEQQKTVCSIMEKEGFIQDEDFDNVVAYNKPPFVNFEMHKCLIPSHDSDYYSYFEKAWEKALITEENSNKYKFSDEDFFIFVFVHMAKHYRGGGIGIRHLIDIWLILNKYKNINTEYIFSELKKLQLEKFYLNIVSTVNNWFNNTSANEITKFITERTFESGSYGTSERHNYATAVKQTQTEGSAKNAQTRQIFEAVFMPISRMKTRYPVLNKAPVLLPIMWAVRWISILFNPKVIKTRSREISQINDKVVADYSAELEKVGLKYELK